MTRHVTENVPFKTGEYPSDIHQFPKLEGFKFSIKINVKMGERFAFVIEEERNLLVDKAVPENTKQNKKQTNKQKNKNKQKQKQNKNQLHAL